MKLLILLAVCAGACYGKIRMHENFFRGRPHDGFVPNPPADVIDRTSKDASIKTLWFTQKLDHFNFGIKQMTTWQQQYMTNSKYYRPGGPMFVMIGGEGPISTGWMDYGDWVKNAKLHGAYLFQLEHRYYGKSRPTPDASVQNLKWLSSQQALADLANFITSMQTSMGMMNNKVIVFGGSYPGNLAAWFRLKYPHVTSGAIASSAPVHAKADFFEYLEVVGASLDYVSPGCSSNVKQAFNMVTSALASNPGSLTQVFGLCSSLSNSTNKMDVATFYESIIGSFQGAVQYNRPGPKSQIMQLCTIMSDTTKGTLLQRLGYIFNQNPNQPIDPNKCMDYSYQGEVNYFKQSTWDSPATSSGARTWIYQTCTEFGYYQTTDSSKQPFGTHMSLPFNEQLCMDVYGVSVSTITSAIQETNMNYGSTNLSAKNVVLVNGSVDPWHALGILSSKGATEIAEYYTGGSHCYDMMASMQNDSPQLIAVRMAIQQQINKFLSS